MILEDIKNKLLEIDDQVHYGTLTEGQNEDIWNYIVFARKHRKTAKDKTGDVKYYEVAIVRENFIPEDDEESVIEKMLELPGMRLSAGDHPYEYTTKKNTETVVEMLVLEFYKASKRG